MVHDLSAKPTDVDAAWIAAGKKLCGMCGYRAAEKGIWRCKGVPVTGKHGGVYFHTCPAPDGDCPGFQAKPSAPRPPQAKKKGLSVAPGITFQYYGRPGAPGAWHEGDRAHQGVVTVAIDQGPGILHLGFSFCSPKDRWCKVTGRDMAMERLYDDPLVVPYLYNPRRSAFDVIRAVLAHNRRLTAFADAVPPLLKVPDWTKGLAERTEGGFCRNPILSVSLPANKGRQRILMAPMEVPLRILAHMMADIAKLEG